MGRREYQRTRGGSQRHVQRQVQLVECRCLDVRSRAMQFKDELLQVVHFIRCTGGWQMVHSTAQSERILGPSSIHLQRRYQQQNLAERRIWSEDFHRSQGVFHNRQVVALLS